MGVAHRRLAPPSWPRLPRRTARLRLTALYGSLFLLSGVALLAATYVLFERATEYKTPQLPKVPHTPVIKKLELPPAEALLKGATVHLPQKPLGLAQAQQTLAQAQYELAHTKPLSVVSVGQGPLAQIQDQLTQAQNQLTQAQHQLAQGRSELAQAVHQLAKVGTLQAAQRAADSHQLLVNSGIALAIVAVLAVLAGWLVAGRMLRPVRTITRAARRISATNLHERLALRGPEDELKELGDTLDDLFERLDAAFDAQCHFVANASHELRTPLTAERTLLQVALDDPDTTMATWRSTAEEVLASNDEQARLIEALLTLASSESGLNEREPVDLATIVGAALVNLYPEAYRRGIQIFDEVTTAPLDGDPLLVERLVANLLANAVRHNVVDGRVEVATGVKEGRAVLAVTNTGPVIPPTEIKRLFQPFQRLDRRRTHHSNEHGLGLSIVRAIATAHHATIAAQPLPEGGLSVTVAFPQPTRPTMSSNRKLRARRVAASQHPQPGAQTSQ
jgi:signal transduction histidine kinase